jgi:hypothetical protein
MVSYIPRLDSYMRSHFYVRAQYVLGERTAITIFSYYEFHPKVPFTHEVNYFGRVLCVSDVRMDD